MGMGERYFKDEAFKCVQRRGGMRSHVNCPFKNTTRISAMIKSCLLLKLSFSEQAAGSHISTLCLKAANLTPFAIASPNLDILPARRD